MKHTPGPWTVEFVQSWPFGVRVTSPTLQILSESAYCHSAAQKTRADCEMGIGFPYKNGGREQAIAAIAEQDANARLIAAAPELLEALELIALTAAEEDRTSSEIALKAIRKAKGE